MTACQRSKGLAPLGVKAREPSRQDERQHHDPERVHCGRRGTVNAGLQVQLACYLALGNWRS